MKNDESTSWSGLDENCRNIAHREVSPEQEMALFAFFSVCSAAKVPFKYPLQLDVLSLVY